MEYKKRLQEEQILKALTRGKSVLLLGPRQTGKTTMLGRIKRDLYLSLVRPDIRQRYEKDPGILTREVEALKKTVKGIPVVFIDEVQKVPKLLDVIQDLVDRGQASFILTGSSARKLKRGMATNLLPGRIVSLRLDPFVLEEEKTGELEDLLLYGSLPGIVSCDNSDDQETDLASYVTTYLEEEIRAEAIVRNLGAFARFLELAAAESGQIVNAKKLSQEIGIAHTTVAGYYDILQDCLIAERIDPLIKSNTRKKLTRSPKYLFFDLGVRRLAAREGVRPTRETWGHWFEQFIGLELLRCSRAQQRRIRLHFWRDPDGPEIDWILDEEGRYLPIEVKWTDSPTSADARHLETFLKEYPQASGATVVCRCPRKMRLSENVMAIPWQDVDSLVLKSK
ncbi:MAG: ATP-binding protein [Candidatus Omnitrophica bacterium]|nr:ATP-binding protein [Candidatus Omnitrophota bacterium]